ncbi:MAG TPA: hypothetical protein VLV87_10035 [Gammaproteobacteria bacterium]|nr:hypothetical protein [Gammaproteobacteria bacterium]
MTDILHDLGERVRHLEDEIEVEIKRRRAALHADFEDRKVRFEAEILAAQRRLKQGLLYYLWDSSILAILSAPVIYAGILPLLFLHAFLWIYQTICFPIYGITKVRQRDCFIFDRYHLGYLNIIEKMNCAYCSYGSGVAAYFREIIGRTEQYWCPIKHARRALHAHAYYRGFTDFGDAEAFRSELAELRRRLDSLK